MRTALCLAAVAALLAVAAAGPINLKPGCHGTDTVKRYPIRRSEFVDRVKKNFVNMAYIQARKRGRVQAATLLPDTCVYIGHRPLRACYNSVIPGVVPGRQIGGQYGFVFNARFKCGSAKIEVPCKVRLNTQRQNRPLSPPVFPDFWEPSMVMCKR